MSSQNDDKKSDPSAASLAQKVGDASQDTYAKAKDALGGVGETLRDPKEALQNAGAAGIPGIGEDEGGCSFVQCLESGAFVGL